MQVIQKYSHAIGSSNLRDDAHHHATEVLHAAAWSGELGSKLFRVKYANDVTTYPALLEAWRDIVKSKAVLRHWPADISPSKIARLSLNHWLNDVCPSCTGRGYQPVAGVPSVMSDIACKQCAGTAKRSIEAKHSLMDYVTAMAEVLDEMSARAAGEMMRKLANEMDF